MKTCFPIEKVMQELDLHFHMTGTPKEILPLNGGDWRRLVNMRIRRERKNVTPTDCRGQNLYTYMRLCSNAFKMRGHERKALAHWFGKQEQGYVPLLTQIYTPARKYQEELMLIANANTPLDTLLLPMNKG